jgi:hypothetical protein
MILESFTNEMDQQNDWRTLAVKLFPSHRKGDFAFQNEWISIYEIFWELKDDALEFHKTGNKRRLKKIYQFAEFCFYHPDDDVGNAVCTAFYEHLADNESTSAQIPYWVQPEIFQFMKDEFVKRREWKGAGKGLELVEKYNEVNGTHYTLNPKEQGNER